MIKPHSKAGDLCSKSIEILDGLQVLLDGSPCELTVNLRQPKQPRKSLTVKKPLNRAQETRRLVRLALCTDDLIG